MRRSPVSPSTLGVDLVEYKKAKKFYTAHQNRLESFFAPSEVRRIRRASKPYQSLALLLAAKEAVFKSSQLPWMGPEGFRKIRIISRKNQELSFRLSGNFKRCHFRGASPRLSWIQGPDYVIAQCQS